MSASQQQELSQPEKPLTLAQKILGIQRKIVSVKKKGFNKEHSYKFLQIEDAVLAVKKLMEQDDLLLSATLAEAPQDREWHFRRDPHPTKGYVNSVILRWTMEDVITGEKREWLIPGEGYDTTDKGGPKAITASRKQALILIFNLPIGDNAEANSATVEREISKQAAQSVASQKIATAAGKGSQTAIDALSQIEPEKKIIIKRPEEHNGNFIAVQGMIAVPQLERFFDDTASKRFKTKSDLVPYWRVPAEYEKGLVALCEKLGIEVEG